jgi:hypothetical protein
MFLSLFGTGVTGVVYRSSKFTTGVVDKGGKYSEDKVICYLYQQPCCQICHWYQRPWWQFCLSSCCGLLPCCIQFCAVVGVSAVAKILDLIIVGIPSFPALSRVVGITTAVVVPAMVLVSLLFLIFKLVLSFILLLRSCCC